MVLDTSKVEIINKSLEKLSDSLSIHRDNHSDNTIIIAIVVGAAISLIPQIIMYIVTNWREKKRKLKELVSEASSQSYLLTEYYKELVMHKVHKQYWLKCSDFPPGDKESHARHFESSEKVRETEDKIRVKMSEYIRAIRLFEALQSYNNVRDCSL